jgi:hypothetical protein
MELVSYWMWYFVGSDIHIPLPRNVNIPVCRYAASEVIINCISCISCGMRWASSLDPLTHILPHSFSKLYLILHTQILCKLFVHLHSKWQTKQQKIELFSSFALLLFFYMHLCTFSYFVSLFISCLSFFLASFFIQKFKSWSSGLLRFAVLR